MNKQDIYVIMLVDGLCLQVGDKEVCYCIVCFCEMIVVDEYVVMQLVECVVDVKGKLMLLVLDDFYCIVLMMWYCECFQCVGLDDIQFELLMLEMFGCLLLFDFV